MSEMNNLDVLLQRLKKIGGSENNSKHDHTNDHIEADWALLRYINVPEITKAFTEIPKWYA